ncbi:MAG: hypothetical protein K1X74_11050 [Pirellulales bacterium]|nr:hypothetical protein [Pirellulales bacterium]
MIDPRKVRPGELCRVLNSTPLGEVIGEPALRRHRTRAGMRIGDARHVDLLRYVAWLVQQRHAPKAASPAASNPAIDLAEAAAGAAALGMGRKHPHGHGQKLTNKQEALIAALLTEPTYAAAAAKAGVSETTLYRWLHRSDFRSAYRTARREMVESAIGRLQAATGQAVETLVVVARQGRRDCDRVRAAVALLEHAMRGLAEGDLLRREGEITDATPMGGDDVIRALTQRLRQLDQADLPTAEKSRLTATLADALLRAIGVTVLDARLEALQNVLLTRKDQA